MSIFCRIDLRVRVVKKNINHPPSLMGSRGWMRAVGSENDEGWRKGTKSWCKTTTCPHSSTISSLPQKLSLMPPHILSILFFCLQNFNFFFCIFSFPFSQPPQFILVFSPAVITRTSFPRCDIRRTVTFGPCPIKLGTWLLPMADKCPEDYTKRLWNISTERQILYFKSIHVVFVLVLVLLLAVQRQ